MHTKREILTLLKSFFEESASAYKIEMAFLYGSWARGFPKSSSDVDVAIVFSEEPGGYKTCLNLIMPEAGSRNLFNSLQGKLRNLSGNTPVRSLIIINLILKREKNKSNK